MKEDILDQQAENLEPEENLAAETEPVEKSEMEILQEELQKKAEEASKNYDLYLRSLAEVENMRKRTQRDKDEYIKYAHVAIIKKLLPIIDDLNRGIKAASQSRDFDTLNKGVEMTAKNLQELLKNEGVEAIDCLGKPFDPQYHEPLMVEPSSEHPENTVIEELSRGYTLHDRVIRPSLVKVSSQSS